MKAIIYVRFETAFIREIGMNVSLWKTRPQPQTNPHVFLHEMFNERSSRIGDEGARMFLVRARRFDKFE